MTQLMNPFTGDERKRLIKIESREKNDLHAGIIPQNSSKSKSNTTTDFSQSLDSY
jgi:hypothetical protein